MECIECKKDYKPSQLVAGKCLDCYRLKAVDTVKKYKQSLIKEVKKLSIKEYEGRDNVPPLELWFIKLKHKVYGFGENVLDKAINKAIDKFSLIIFGVLVIVVAIALLKRK